MTQYTSLSKIFKQPFRFCSYIFSFKVLLLMTTPTASEPFSGAGHSPAEYGEQGENLTNVCESPSEGDPLSEVHLSSSGSEDGGTAGTFSHPPAHLRTYG